MLFIIIEYGRQNVESCRIRTCAVSHRGLLLVSQAESSQRPKHDALTTRPNSLIAYIRVALSYNYTRVTF